MLRPISLARSLGDLAQDGGTVHGRRFLPGLEGALGRGERAVQVGFGGVGSWPSTSSVAGLMTSWVRLPSPARNSPSIYSANCSYMPVVPCEMGGGVKCVRASLNQLVRQGRTSFARRTGANPCFPTLAPPRAVDTMRAPLAVRTRYPPCNPSTRIRPASTPGFFRFIDWLRHRIALSSLVGDHPIFDNSQFPWVSALEAQTPPSAPSCWNSFQSAIIFRLFTRFPRCRHDHVGQSVEDLRLHGLRPAVGPQPAALSGHRSGAGRHSRPAHRLFSILEPGKRIPLHTGPYNGYCDCIWAWSCRTRRAVLDRGRRPALQLARGPGSGVRRSVSPPGP